MSGEYYNPVLGGGRITSGVGRRQSPGGIGSRNHGGIDIAGPIGTGIVAPVSGTVLRAGVNGGYGNFIEIRGGDGYIHRFGHLNSIGVQAGQVVQGGAQIGTLGNTGRSTGPHLHYEVRDRAGNVAGNIAQSVVNRGRQMARGAIDRARGAVTGAIGGMVTGGPVGAVTGAIGGAVSPGGGILDSIRAWFAETDFFTRLAMVLLGLLFVAAAFAWIGRSQLTSTISRTIKG